VCGFRVSLCLPRVRKIRASSLLSIKVFAINLRIRLHDFPLPQDWSVDLSYLWKFYGSPYRYRICVASPFSLVFAHVLGIQLFLMRMKSYTTLGKQPFLCSRSCPWSTFRPWIPFSLDFPAHWTLRGYSGIVPVSICRIVFYIDYHIGVVWAESLCTVVLKSE